MNKQELLEKYSEGIKVLDSGFVRLVDWMGDDTSAVQAARVSYAGGTKTIREDNDLTRFLMRHEHFSPFAMAQIKLHVRLPVFIHNQWVRHDRFAWNVMSGRYSKMPEEKWSPTPSEVRGQGTGNKQVGSGNLVWDVRDAAANDAITRAYREIDASYAKMLKWGVAREQARTVLPMGQYTEAYVTANLGDWMLFLKARLSDHAQEEIRVYAEAVRTILSTIFPNCIQAFEDYALNSVTFSGDEMEALRRLLEDARFVTKNADWHYILTAPQAPRQEFLEDCGLTSKRERIEFFRKIK